MKVSILVCTFGDDAWRAHGQRVKLACSEQTYPAHEVVALHERDSTLAEVRNAAALNATGDWLCFVDADDLLETNYLEQMRAGWDTWKWQGSGPPLLVPAVRYFKKDRMQDAPQIPAWGRPIEEINCAVIGTLVSRQMFLDVGGFREWPMYEDWDLWLRCIQAGAELFPVPGAVYLAYISEGRNTNSDDVATTTYWAIRREHEAACATG